MAAPLTPREAVQLREYLGNKDFLVSEERQTEIAQRLESLRTEYQLHLLANHTTLMGEAVRVSEVISGERALQKVFSVPGTAAKGKKNRQKVKEALPGVLNSLTYLIALAQHLYYLLREGDVQAAGNRSLALIDQLALLLPEEDRQEASSQLKEMISQASADFLELQETSDSSELQREIYQAIHYCRQGAALLLQDFTIFPAHYRALAKTFQKDMKEIQRLRRMLSAKNPKPEAAQQLQAMEDRYGLRYASAEKSSSHPSSLAKLAAVVKRLSRQCQETREQLTESCLLLVVNIAKRYRNQGLPFLDLIQEGNIGLMTAVDKFEASRGNRLSTHATWWIRQAVGKAIKDQRSTVRSPVHFHEMIRKINQKKRDFFAEHGREPKDDEWAEICDIPLEDLRMILSMDKKTRSIDKTSNNEEGEARFGDFIEDEGQIDPATAADRGLLVEAIKRRMEILNPADREAIRLRYGIGEDAGMRAKDVAAALGISEKAISPRIQRGIRRLKDTSLRDLAREYDPDIKIPLK